MDVLRAKELVSVLAEGIDPITGEVLPSNHVCNNVEIVRAFYTLIKHANIEPKNKKYENACKRWTDEEDKLLRELYEQGMRISEIQRKFMRSRGSIESRLARLGLAEEKYYYRKR